MEALLDAEGGVDRERLLEHMREHVPPSAAIRRRRLHSKRVYASSISHEASVGGLIIARQTLSNALRSGAVSIDANDRVFLAVKS